MTDEYYCAYCGKWRKKCRHNNLMISEFSPEHEEQYEAALSNVFLKGYATTPDLQRVLGCGYTLAQRIVERMEAEKVVGPYKTGAGRKLLIKSREEYLKSREKNDG